ncbi:kinase-like domain-containing protein [Armillaria novae-zelandiae]|uniref:non-specific serine/threonine protein kinase n=1 Tax=Armillaria novae-zelandiae TaxID=153914 RepID=A0AA39NZU5_9AGAR|nr:kinase-like domain-containing protein [Armillaria novae-zelandiae]
MEYTFGGKYRLEQEIANGGCGTVFMGTHNVAGKPVAIKLEPSEPKRSRRRRHSDPDIPQHHHHQGPSPLKLESQIYKRLMGGPGVPWIMYSGKQGDYNVMVIDLLGPSLEDLFRMCNRCFSLKTVLLLADQLISRIQYIHSHSLLHRDIKPANFVMGTGKSVHQVNIIDFGLAKKFRDSRTAAHIPYKQDDVHGVGTSLFAAINTHLGVESSRRDDLESLAYMLIYFLKGTLPWRKMRAPTHPPPGTPDYPPYNPVTETWNIIRDAKLKAEEKLTQGLPPEFDVLYRYARSLSFDDLPDYEGLRELFRGLAKRVDVEYDGVFDWTVPPPSSPSASSSSVPHAEEEATGGRFCEACRKKRQANANIRKR